MKGTCFVDFNNERKSNTFNTPSLKKYIHKFLLYISENEELIGKRVYYYELFYRKFSCMK
jgi:hypothetical protein